MPIKLGRGLNALISRDGETDNATRISELRAKLSKVEAEYSDLKDRTDSLRKRLTMEIVMGSNIDMTELRSMEGRLLDLDLERKEIIGELPMQPSGREEKDPNALSTAAERKKRSSEIDMEMIRIMIAEVPEQETTAEDTNVKKDESLINETDEILKDLRSLQESHAQLEVAPEADPVMDRTSREIELAKNDDGPYTDPAYYQSIKNEIHPKVVLRKIKQEANISPEKPSLPKAQAVVRKPAISSTQSGTAYVKKRLVRKVKAAISGPSGSKNELSALLRTTTELIEEGSFDRALPMLEEGIGKYGSEGDQSILCQIGSVYFEKGDMEKANDRFRQVVRMNPLNARAINNLGVILKKQKRYEESIRIINQAIEMDPNYEKAWYELGCVFMEIQPPLLKEASIFLRRALEIDPRFERAREQLRICTEKLHPS